MDAPVRTAFDVRNPYLADWLRQQSVELSGNVNKTTLENLTETLSEGIQEGEGIPALKQRVEGVYGEARGSRAKMIARTEANKAANGAGWVQAEQSGVVKTKTWLATKDGRTRPAHLALNGETVPIDEPFSNGKMFPDEVNCRCTLTYGIDESKLTPPDERVEGIPAEALDEYPQLANLGPLRIEEYDHPEIRRHVDDLAKVPPAIARGVRDRGLKDIHVAPRGMPDLDDNAEVKGVRPRGWPEGSTWDIVPGAYNPKAKSVAAGYTPQGHGTGSLALHEYGHAVDDAFKLYRQAYFVDLHREIYDDIQRPYYKQGGPGGQAGIEEMIAEGFGLWAKGDARGLRDTFGERGATRLSELFTKLNDELQ